MRALGKSSEEEEEEFIGYLVKRRMQVCLSIQLLILFHVCVTGKEKHVSSDTPVYTWRAVCVCCLCLSLPDFDDAVSGWSDDEALRRLKRGDVGDDVVVSHRERFRSTARRVLHHPTLLFTVDLLQRRSGHLCLCSDFTLTHSSLSTRDKLSQFRCEKTKLQLVPNTVQDRTELCVYMIWKCFSFVLWFNECRLVGETLSIKKKNHKMCRKWNHSKPD